jgi:hypothetical protein
MLSIAKAERGVSKSELAIDIFLTKLEDKRSKLKGF